MTSHAQVKIIWAYAFLLPLLLYFTVFTIYPIVMSYVYSTFDWNGLGPLENFVFLNNYKQVLADDAFWNAFTNNLIFIFFKTIILVPLALVTAIILNLAYLKGKTFFRTVYFLPVVTTASVIGVVMKFIFGNDNALVNNILIWAGVIHKAIPWLAQANTAFIVLIGISIWKSFGMIMVYWLAGLQSLPEDTFEAAKIDGANAWQTFWYITLPMLAPVGTVIVLLTVVNSMHVFDLAKTLTDGGPFFATDMMDLYIYRYAFGNAGFPQMGYASAAGIVFGLAVFLITLVLSGIVRAAKAEPNGRKKGVV